ncbi:hypothetical protein M3P05_05730 [Sansalvadorimonas sp. 2012CJ34-2]|uniref:Uncharacterized protein n=1 Tax=Parendozoicomonas callyspongiae TaxID=2942213 RepID=A0ABT0PDK1_9GAMM|nr:hypothetical protein [Sansalvadorimonas sp. 2012CJ34-2]MCL6269444.1 hypothetical protein [Sansalvadorimonas sp. 2012CJ34-2]
MATNGSSARQWLADNGKTASSEELLRIRNAIAAKLDKLPEGHPEEDGLLEALDVMDEWRETRNVSAPVASSLQDSDLPAPQLDTSSLTPDLPPAPKLSQEEKQTRFQKLLQKSKPGMSS